MGRAGREKVMREFDLRANAATLLDLVLAEQEARTDHVTRADPPVGAGARRRPPRRAAPAPGRVAEGTARAGMAAPARHPPDESPSASWPSSRS
jgi:hypothetical protein